MSEIPTVYDRSELSVFDVQLKEMVDIHYNFCLQRCNESNSGLMDCKRHCAKTIVVPFRMTHHRARENEEADVRRCLAKHPDFPNVDQKTILNCSNISYADRVERLTNHIHHSAISVYNICKH